MQSSWIDYFPDLMTPWGMVFYSVIAYIMVMIHTISKRRTVENYVDKTLKQSIQKSLKENRKKRSDEAERLLNGLPGQGNK